MALTEFQREICQLIARHRIAQGESYVAGGAALGEALGTQRISRDVDLFHDTETALAWTWEQDRRLLEAEGYGIAAVRERPAFVEAVVSRAGESVLMEWARDSAFRFFPLVEHPIFGLMLHPFDLATNKVLALVGRLEVRDWIDLIECHRRLQRLGYLAWAACGKDPGFSPTAILAEAKRSGRYNGSDISGLDFAGPLPDMGVLSREWREMLQEAEGIVHLLPASHAGDAVLASDGTLFHGGTQQLSAAIEQDTLLFHAGAVRGAWPQLKTADG
jgi:hypothetical protein